MSPFEPLPTFYASDFWRIFYTAWAGGLFLVLLPYGVLRLRRHGEWTSLLVVLGGLICSLGEPMMDQLAHVTFAANMPGPAFVGFGRAVPWFVPFCYASVISGAGYASYRYLLKARSTSRILMVWAASAVADMVLEMPGTLTGAFRYFGDQPFAVLGFPLHVGVLNATGFFAIGFAIYVVAPRLRGGWTATLLLIPAMAFWGAQSAVAWPAWMAVNWPLGPVAQHLVALLVVPLSLVLVKGMAWVVVAAGDPVSAIRPDPAPAPAP